MHLSHFMIIIGAFLLAGGAYFTWPLLKKTSHYQQQWVANFTLICFFLCSYLFAIIYGVWGNPFFTNYFYSTIFLLGGIYVFWVSYLSAKTIEKTKIIDDLILKYEKIRYQAEHDKLTGCYNRHYLMEILDNRYQKIKLNSGHLIVIFIDLDGFKKVNDEYGHDFGDHILQRFCHLLRQQLRKEDVMARYGGDEFVVLIENINLKKAGLIGQKIIKITSQLTKEILKQGNLILGCSIGISQLIHSSPSIDSALKKADAACYKAKKNYGNTICFEDGIQSEATCSQMNDK
ncbi:GGDEF domain-containing protein [Legionella septentrionalis]|uniref:diguanylate cyclase n=2 Tax=Legionellaceae TaxID=444 RepID=A0A433JGI2_9GAMM|nr:GGDEF domain-containing protein [Legionella septentrionalis]RUR12983.1 GGDEF domain-containing protein [Legionella septentrionalis]